MNHRINKGITAFLLTAVLITAAGCGRINTSVGGQNAASEAAGSSYNGDSAGTAGQTGQEPQAQSESTVREPADAGETAGTSAGQDEKAAASSDPAGVSAVDPQAGGEQKDALPADPAATGEPLSADSLSGQTKENDDKEAAGKEEPDPADETENADADADTCRLISLEEQQVDLEEITGELNVYSYYSRLTAVEPEVTELSGNEIAAAANETEKINRGLAKAAELTRTYAQGFLEDYMNEVASQWDPKNEEFPYCTCGAELALRRSDTNVISFVADLRQSGLESFPLTRMIGFNIDPQSGEFLKLDQVVKDMDAFSALFKACLPEAGVKEKSLKKAEKKAGDLLKSPDLTSDDALSWTVDYEGLTFWMNAAVNFPFTGEKCGTVRIFIPFKGNEACFEKKYLQRPESYVYEIPSCGTSQAVFMPDLDGDGEPDRTEVKLKKDGDGNGEFSGMQIISEKLDLSLGLSFDTFTYSGRFLAAHIAGDESEEEDEDSGSRETAGTDYLIVQMMQDNDYTFGRLYRISEDMNAACSYEGDVFADRYYSAGEDDKENEDPDQAGSDKVERATQLMTDPEHFLIAGTTDLMGTSSVQRFYSIGADGKIKAADKYFTYSGVYEFTAKKPVEAAAVDESGKELGTESVPAGTKLTAYRTDKKSYVEAKDDGGRIFRFAVSKDEESWEDKIGGVPVTELFDGIMYAG